MQQPSQSAPRKASFEKPKLVLVVVVDQFRYDYLIRFRGSYNGGIGRLLTEGAVFTDARYPQYPTVTATGHATVLTGATPSSMRLLSISLTRSITASAARKPAP